MGEVLKPWTIEPCEQCGREHYLTRTYGRDRRPVEVCGECAAHERGASEAAPATPPRPLVALLTEALAVTDPEKPPTYAGVEADIGTSLHWHTPSMVVLVRNPTGWRLLQEAMPTRTTTDPAEARAWLAAALGERTPDTGQAGGGTRA